MLSGMKYLSDIHIEKRSLEDRLRISAKHVAEPKERGCNIARATGPLTSVADRINEGANERLQYQKPNSRKYEHSLPSG